MPPRPLPRLPCYRRAVGGPAPANSPRPHLPAAPSTDPPTACAPRPRPPPAPLRRHTVARVALRRTAHLPVSSSALARPSDGGGGSRARARGAVSRRPAFLASSPARSHTRAHPHAQPPPWCARARARALSLTPTQQQRHTTSSSRESEEARRRRPHHTTDENTPLLLVCARRARARTRGAAAAPGKVSTTARGAVDAASRRCGGLPGAPAQLDASSEDPRGRRPGGHAQQAQQPARARALLDGYCILRHTPAAHPSDTSR